MNSSTPRVFIAATRQNDGKTTASLGLIAALQRHFPRVGYIKPVGQRFVEVEEQKIDEDTVLMDAVYRMNCPLVDMSPIAVEPAFTRKYLEAANNEALVKRIQDAFDRVAWEKDFVLCEGSGHAGVGSVFDLSNAQVAKILGAKVIIVTQGGIGKPIDEVCLNRALFEKEGVEVIGVIINKVLEAKIPEITRFVSRGLRRKNLELLGVLPHPRLCPMCRISNDSDSYSQLAVQGPRALETLQKLTKVDLAAIKNYWFTWGEVAGVPNVLIARTGYTGEDGFEVYIPADAADHGKMWNALMEAGAEFGIRPCGLGARNTLRLEAGMPLYGHEISDQINVWEAGLDRWLRLRQGRIYWPRGFAGGPSRGRSETQARRLWKWWNAASPATGTSYCPWTESRSAQSPPVRPRPSSKPTSPLRCYPQPSPPAARMCWCRSAPIRCGRSRFQRHSISGRKDNPRIFFWP